MENVKNDFYHVGRIVSDIEFVLENMMNVEYQEFCENEILQDAMMFRLIQISENSRKLSDEYREKNQEIPWGDMFGLRNRIVHNYGAVDLRVVYDTLRFDLDEVYKVLTELGG